MKTVYRCLFPALFVVLISSVFCLADGNISRQQAYVAKWSDLAVSEMYRSGIPASITLAQGILESASGTSYLALQGNNHFAVKCHNDWKGQRIYRDDDNKNDCFRKYKTPEESFYDHSDFLRYRDRYKFLFDLEITDYKGWAYGLKKAGYATDPDYAAKLIAVIETYSLYEYDSQPSKEAEAAGTVTAQVPQSPNTLEQPHEVTARTTEIVDFQLSRKKYSINGVKFIYSETDETYASIARMYNLFPSEVMKFNDAKSSDTILPVGSVVYIQKKKKQASRGLDKYVSEGGESLRDVAQRYAVRLSSLSRLNGVTEDYVTREGDVIKLRKK